MCLNGDWGQWGPFFLDRKEAEHKLALSDTLHCLYKGHISAWGLTFNLMTKGSCLLGDKKVKLPPNEVQSV